MGKILGIFLLDGDVVLERHVRNLDFLTGPFTEQFDLGQLSHHGHGLLEVLETLISSQDHLPNSLISGNSAITATGCSKFSKPCSAIEESSTQSSPMASSLVEVNQAIKA